MRWRAELLESGLGECIRHQTSPWEAAYLLLAEGDEGFFDEHIDRDVFRPIYLRDGADSNVGLRDALARDGFSGEVILSRVDSDDLITKDYLERVVAAAHESAGVDRWLVAVDGQRSDMQRVQSFHYPESPFISRHLRNRTRESIFRNHRDVRRLDPVAIDGVLWWQLLHGSNLANKFWRPRPVESYDPDHGFSGELNDFDAHEFRESFGFAHERLSEVIRQAPDFASTRQDL
ncbi:hypothetical protein [Microbacterium resistens]